MQVTAYGHALCWDKSGIVVIFFAATFLCFHDGRATIKRTPLFLTHALNLSIPMSRLRRGYRCAEQVL
jgi:hypothetical protein